MKRFLMLVGVAVVAAAMYVAAGSASQQSKGPSAKQFSALKKQVAGLSKQVKTLQNEDKVVIGVLAACMQAAVPIDQFGDGSAAQTEGYDYSQPAGAGNFLTTALDVSDASDTGALYITGGDASCGTLINGSALQHAAARAGVRLPGAAAHPWSFTPHRR